MIKDHIKSIRTAVGKDYTRPDPERISVFVTELHKCDKALEYLKAERGFTEETIEHFNLGYDKDKHAISIPIYKEGELINIKYRFIEPDDLRYTSERNAETWLFNDDGLNEAKNLGGVLVVEGEIDAMSAWQAGIKNVVSTASGKDSYGVWIELLDKIKRVYVAFDNDEGGKASGKKFAERVGQEKSYEFNYPDGIKDANEFFKENDIDSFKELVKGATPYYSYQFKNVGDVITSVREGEEPTIESQWVPKVKFEKDWLCVLSGDTNVGKTTYAMNVAKDFAEQGIPTLVFPFERGIVSVGKRFLQIFFKMTSEDFVFASNDEWDKMIEEVMELPVYFATPKKNDIVDIIKKSKRFFDTKVVIIDHLDYIVRNTANTERDIANALQSYKTLGQELGIIFVVVTHLRKRDSTGRPHLQDLKGSSSLSQDPECVILLSEKGEGVVTVDVAKNKGYMGRYDFGIEMNNGTLSHDLPDNEWQGL
jgi:5S rRNA maturation endonuclease (ribonuclease M5)